MVPFWARDGEGRRDAPGWGKRQKADAGDVIPCILEPERTDWQLRRNPYIDPAHELCNLECPFILHSDGQNQTPSRARRDPQQLVIGIGSDLWPFWIDFFRRSPFLYETAVQPYPNQKPADGRRAIYSLYYTGSRLQGSAYFLSVTFDKYYAKGSFYRKQYLGALSITHYFRTFFGFLG